MDEKNLDTKIRRSYSDSSEEKDEGIADTSSDNISEPSVAKGCSINHENSNTRSGEIGEQSCTASYAEMDTSDAVNAYGKSSHGLENLISTKPRAFTENREQSSGYSADSSASQNSTVNVSEEEGESQQLSFERKCFENELKPNTNIAGFSCENNAINSNAVDTQNSSSAQQIDRNMRKRDALRRYFDSLEKCSEDIVPNQQLITQSEEQYKGESASLPNTTNPSSRFLYSYVNPFDLEGKKRLVEDEDNRTLNTLDNMSCVQSALNNIFHEMQQEKESDERSISGGMPSNASDISDESKEIEIVKNNDLVLTDMTDIVQCPKISPIDDKSGREKSLNDISEVMTCSKLTNDSESIRIKASSLKNRNEISSHLDIASNNKENHPNETEVNQYKTFKRSRSHSPTGGRESKLIKPSPPAESPTSTLKNVDINLTKRPASPGDNLFPESGVMVQEIKKQKKE